MRRFIFAFGLIFVAFTAAALPARAQNDTPRQLQAMISNGQAQTALGELQTIVQAHPGSGVAWYLTAEAQDATGNDAAARTALGNADHFAPGLPFANQKDVAALRARLNNAGSMQAAQPHSGISPMLVGIVVLVILFMVFRMFRRRRYMTPPGYQGGYGPGGQGPNPGPYPYNQGPGMGGGMGIGGSILGGLAAGAGFAAGERVIGDMMGGNNNNSVDNAWGNQPTANPDDGLQGSPGWDSGSTPDDSNFDSGNSW